MRSVRMQLCLPTQGPLGSETTVLSSNLQVVTNPEARHSGTGEEGAQRPFLAQGTCPSHAPFRPARSTGKEGGRKQDAL